MCVFSISSITKQQTAYDGQGRLARVLDSRDGNGSTRSLSPPTHIGTCGFGVSSLAPTTIMWAHLIAAFDTLNMFCVQNPISRIKGGRAYYGKQSVSSWINGKAKRNVSSREYDDDDDDGTTVNATEALPPGINATIFRHDAGTEMACEWSSAVERKNVSSCWSD